MSVLFCAVAVFCGDTVAAALSFSEAADTSAIEGELSALPGSFFATRVVVATRPLFVLFVRATATESPEERSAGDDEGSICGLRKGEFATDAADTDRSQSASEV